MTRMSPVRLLDFLHGDTPVEALMMFEPFELRNYGRSRMLRFKAVNVSTKTAVEVALPMSRIEAIIQEFEARAGTNTVVQTEDTKYAVASPSFDELVRQFEGPTFGELMSSVK